MLSFYGAARTEAALPRIVAPAAAPKPVLLVRSRNARRLIFFMAKLYGFFGRALK